MNEWIFNNQNITNPASLTASFAIAGDEAATFFLRGDDSLVVKTTLDQPTSAAIVVSCNTGGLTDVKTAAINQVQAKSNELVKLGVFFKTGYIPCEKSNAESYFVDYSYFKEDPSKFNGYYIETVDQSAVIITDYNDLKLAADACAPRLVEIYTNSTPPFGEIILIGQIVAAQDDVGVQSVLDSDTRS